MTAAAFQTARLNVAPWGPRLRNAAAYARLCQDLDALLTEPVLRHLPPSVQRPNGPHPIQTWIADRDSACAVSLIEAGTQLIGLLFLFHPPDAPPDSPLHLGYMLTEAAWGQGYASELVAGLVSALQDGPPITLQGGVDRANPASARVLEKAGFARADALGTEDIEIFIWSTAPT